MTVGEYLLEMKEMQERAAVEAWREGDEFGAEFHRSAAEGFAKRMARKTINELMEEAK